MAEMACKNGVTQRKSAITFDYRGKSDGAAPIERQYRCRIFLYFCSIHANAARCYATAKIDRNRGRQTRKGLSIFGSYAKSRWDGNDCKESLRTHARDEEAIASGRTMKSGRRSRIVAARVLSLESRAKNARARPQRIRAAISRAACREEMWSRSIAGVDFQAKVVQRGGDGARSVEVAPRFTEIDGNGCRDCSSLVKAIQAALYKTCNAYGDRM